MSAEARLVWFLLDEISRFARWKDDPGARARHRGLTPHESIYENHLVPLMSEVFETDLILTEKPTEDDWDATLRKSLRLSTQALALVCSEEPDLDEVCTALSQLYSFRCAMRRLAMVE